ncbi:hypothetical protein MPSEU_000473400 [Mayamaea pseudoterrestris]|nr:hypothetical protein MPSEU_000473400 [Mayamaea pseudoterrestris]
MSLLPGQKHPTPTPGFGDRVFYETLLRQRPDSAMAQQWCVDYGVLSVDEAEKVYNICLKRKGKLKVLSSPSPPPKKKKTKAKVIKEETDGPDLQVSGGDGIGRVVL